MASEFGAQYDQYVQEMERLQAWMQTQEDGERLAGMFEALTEVLNRWHDGDVDPDEVQPVIEVAQHLWSITQEQGLGVLAELLQRVVSRAREVLASS